MIRNLKALGLALVAVLAFGALVASSASAQTLGKLTSTGPVTLIGEETGEKTNSLTILGSSIVCTDGGGYTGHRVRTAQETNEGKPHELLPVGSTEITVTRHYKQTSGGTASCEIEGLSLTTTMNGCDYRFYDFTTKEPTPGLYTFKTDIVCPTERQIEMHLYFAHSHTKANQCYVLTIPPQTVLTGGEAEHTEGAADDIHLKGAIKGIKVIRDSKNIVCPATEGFAEQHLDATLKGYNAAKENTAVTITH